jgi:DNA-binding transcriptional MerR regulator
MLNEKSYTISELAEVAEVTIRTIRYYVGEGLLPSPEAGGRAATYNQGHLARLNLIKLLKDEFLPLHEIRALLSGLDDRAVVELLADKQTQPAAPPAAPDSAKAYLQTLLQPPDSPAQGYSLLRHKLKAQQIREDVPEMTGEALLPAPVPLPGATSMPENQLLAVSKGLAQSMPLLPVPPVEAGPVESWRRYQLTPGIELHVKEGVENSSLGQKVEQLIKIARQILSSFVVC